MVPYMAVLNERVSAYFPQFIRQNRPMVSTSLSPEVTLKSVMDIYETRNDHEYRPSHLQAPINNNIQPGSNVNL
jgi:hypothetical protein